MRVLAACSLGGAGHLLPLVAVLAAAGRRGDETLVVGPAGLATMVEAVGHPFRAGGEPPEDQVAPLRERLATAPPPEASVVADRDLFARLATTAMLPAMDQVFGEWPPELVLRDPCEYASAILAGRRGIPAARVAISPAETEASCLTVAAPELDAHRPGLAEELWASPYVTRFPPSVDPSPFPGTLRYRGPTAPPPAPLPDWWAGSRAPLVYATFGTVVGYLSTAGAVYGLALGALGSVTARVLLTVGTRIDPAGLGDLPANVHVEAWVDQARVVAQADLVVCHGGSGTTLGALAAGVPVVAVPLFADQGENGRRIADAGAGVVVEGGLTPPGGPDRLADAVRTVLGDPSYRHEARRIAAEMAAAPTAEDVLSRLGGG